MTIIQPWQCEGCGDLHDGEPDYRKDVGDGEIWFCDDCTVEEYF